MSLYIPGMSDRLGLGRAATTLADVLGQRLENQKAQEAQRQRSTLLDQTFSAISEADNPQDKILAIQKYSAETGDNQAFGPLLNDILKEQTQQRQAQATFDFLSPFLGDVGGEGGTQVPPGVSPGAISGLTQLAKPTFEPEADKLEAKRVSELADKVVSEYEGAETANERLNQMEVAAESGKLPSPLLVRSMEALNIPLGVYADPLSQNYEKNVNEFVREVKNYFPGRVTNTELEFFMKSIPSLMNSDEGKKLIIKNMKLRNEMAKSRYEAYMEILEKNGGRKPKNLDIKINNRTKEQRRLLGDEMKKNIEEARDIAKLPEKAAYKDQQVSVGLATKYLQSAGGDVKKARELARRDGYDF